MCDNTQKTERLQRLTEALTACTDEEISVAIALLPDYRPNGIAIVTAAMARIVAENVNSSKEEDFLQRFKESIATTRQTINNNTK